MSTQQMSEETEKTVVNNLVVLPVLCSGMFMAILDVNAVNVAAANLQQQLGASLASLTWIVDAYNLTLAGFMLSGGILADRYGKRRIWGLGLAIFLIGSLGCGVSWGVEPLIVFRLIQGAGAALFIPASFSLITEIWSDPASRQRAIGLFGGLIAVSAAVGPVVGGVMVDTFGWRSLFFVNLPIGALGVLFCWKVLPVSCVSQLRPLDVFGQTLCFCALASLCYVLIQLPIQTTMSSSLLQMSGVAVICFVGFFLVERFSAAPGMPLSMFRGREFNWANLTGISLNMSYFGGIYILSLMLQDKLHLTPTQTGFALLPLAICLVLGNIYAGRLVECIGVKRQMFLGLFIGAWGYAGLMYLPQGVSGLFITAMIALAGGVALAIPPMTSTVLRSVAPELVATASAVHTTCRQTGTLLGVALASLVLSFSHEPLLVFMGGSAAAHAFLAFGSFWAFQTRRV